VSSVRALAQRIRRHRRDLRLPQREFSAETIWRNFCDFAERTHDTKNIRSEVIEREATHWRIRDRPHTRERISALGIPAQPFFDAALPVVFVNARFLHDHCDVVARVRLPRGAA
jgi:hypothetical protein